MNNLVIMKDKQAVTTSLQVSENFEKNHQHVLRDLDGLKEGVQNWTDLFWEDTYIHPQNKQPYRMIYMNRDGFTLLAMGFTGKKALDFKLKYIEAFNQMESEIKKQLDISRLSPDLQMFHSLFTTMAEQQIEFTYQKERQEKLETKVDNISEIVSLNTTDWRKDAQHLINKIVHVMGNSPDVHREIRNNIFAEIDRRGGVALKTRLTNKRRRMAEEGVSRSRRDKLTSVDVIADDKKLVEIYVAVVKEFAIKYGVYKEEA